MESSSGDISQTLNAIVCLCGVLSLRQKALLHVVSERLHENPEIVERECQQWVAEHEDDLLPVLQQEVKDVLRRFGVQA